MYREIFDSVGHAIALFECDTILYLKKQSIVRSCKTSHLVQKKNKFIHFNVFMSVINTSASREEEKGVFHLFIIPSLRMLSMGLHMKTIVCIFLQQTASSLK